jgi:glyoxylase-like metal-dependent hydrolase (beta-lactamase superfamily II)
MNYELEESPMIITTIPVGMLGTNCYLLESAEKGCAVIDPGAQPHKIIRQIEERTLTPRYILLTHGHHDHIGGVKKIMAAYPEILLYIGEKDKEMLGDTQKSLAIFRQDDDTDYLIGDAVAVSGGDTLLMDELEIAVMDTPGHTKGGVSYLCGDALFAGDTLFRENVGRTDLYGGDFEILLASLAELAALEGEYTVYPGHGEATTLGHERRHNPYLTGDRR